MEDIRYTPSVLAKWLTNYEAKVMDRFWRQVDKTGECWLWTGSVDDFGYGDLNFLGRHSRAHRISYEVFNGPLTDNEGMVVRHKCDVPPCVNPKHLILGTKLENAQDRDARGRSGTVGERNHKAKVTETQVREIRARFTGERGQATTMMREFGITAPAFYAIVRGTGWKHVV